MQYISRFWKWGRSSVFCTCVYVGLSSRSSILFLYSYQSTTTVAFPLSAGRIKMLLSFWRLVIAHLTIFTMFCFGGLALCRAFIADEGPWTKTSNVLMLDNSRNMQLFHYKNIDIIKYGQCIKSYRTIVTYRMRLQLYKLTNCLSLNPPLHLNVKTYFVPTSSSDSEPSEVSLVPDSSSLPLSENTSDAFSGSLLS